MTLMNSRAGAAWIAILIVLASGCGGRSAALSAASARPAVPTDAPIREGTDLVKTAGTVIAVDGDRVWLRITDRNQGSLVVWNNRTVTAHANPRTVFPGLGVQRLADAHLSVGQVVTFTFVPAEYDDQLAAYPAVVLGREQRSAGP